MSNDKPKSALRELLEEGPVDKRLIASLDVLEELQAAVARKDTKATLEIGRRLAAKAKDLKAAASEWRSAMEMAIEKAMAVSDPREKTAKLLDAFEFCAKTEAIANDEAGDRETANIATKHIFDIVVALDALPPNGRLALAPFLDNPHVNVRALAAVHLKNLMPERTVPILQEIKEKEAGCAGWTALWALPPNPWIEAWRGKGSTDQT